MNMTWKEMGQGVEICQLDLNSRAVGMIIQANNTTTCFLWNGNTWIELAMDYNSSDDAKNVIEGIIEFILK